MVFSTATAISQPGAGQATAKAASMTSMATRATTVPAR